jgi:hypothetical protein
MSQADLRRLEADFAKRVGSRLNPQSPVQIGPKGATLNVQIGIQIPFVQFLTQKTPTGEPAIPDEALILIIQEALAEAKARGLKY